MTTEKYYSVSQAAKEAKIGRQAVYVAIKQKRLRAEKISGHWMITATVLDEYKLNKYNRALRRTEEGLIFDNSKGLYSVPQAQALISMHISAQFPIQKLYYLLRTGQVRSDKIGAAWIIKKEEILRLINDQLGTQNQLKAI